MALPLIPIVKTLPTILTILGEITASLRARKAAGDVAQMEDRVRKLEDDLLRTSTALTEVTAQLQAIAVQLQRAHDRTQTRTRQITLLAWVAGGALACSVVTLVIALSAGGS